MLPTDLPYFPPKSTIDPRDWFDNAPPEPIWVFAEPPDQRFIVVSVENSPGGRATFNLLAEEARRFALIWIGTLADELRRAGVRNSTMCDELPHLFALLQIAGGSEAMALRDLYRFECRKRDGARPFTAVEPDYPLHYSAPAKIGAQYDLRASGSFHDRYRKTFLNVDRAYQNGVFGDNINVAVVDSGVEKAGIAKDFEDLEDPANNNVIDANGHGTAMTSIIHDLAPKANVTAIRISDGLPRMWKLIMGVASASFGHAADIINISMGLDSIPTVCGQCGLSSPGLSNNLEYFLQGISNKSVGANGPPVLVASTGNDGHASGFTYPANWDFTVAVGSVDSNLARSSFSNYGNTNHPAFIVMPGGEEDPHKNPTEWIGKGAGGECYGTSPATAYASGVLALYFSDLHYKQTNRKQLLAAVLANCEKKFGSYDPKQHGQGFLPYI
jgi:Subtilase family